MPRAMQKELSVLSSHGSPPSGRGPSKQRSSPAKQAHAFASRFADCPSVMSDSMHGLLPAMSPHRALRSEHRTQGPSHIRASHAGP